MKSPGFNLERDILNHYASGNPGAPVRTLPDGRRPFRTVNLPAWQIRIIKGHPSLYLTEEDVGITDYCNLGLGFEVGVEWTEAIEGMSQCGSWLVQTLRASRLQDDARIAVVRVRDIGGRLRTGASDNLLSPYREFWHSFVLDYLL